jgi:Domain of unknown function (DUF4124)
MKTIALVAVPALLLFFTAPALAAFRCTDKDGKTVYMERPCNTYGYTTTKEVKDPPKGDGSATLLGDGQSLASPADRAALGSTGVAGKVPFPCAGQRIWCTRGDKVKCGNTMKVCDAD